LYSGDASVARRRSYASALRAITGSTREALGCANADAAPLITLPVTGPYGNDRVPDLTTAFDGVLFIDRMLPATMICQGRCP
jgi:hypothetical protein